MMKILLYRISSASKIDCIYLIFLQVFAVSCFDLGGSNEPPEPPLDPPQHCLFHLLWKIPLEAVAKNIVQVLQFNRCQTDI